MKTLCTVVTFFALAGMLVPAGFAQTGNETPVSLTTPLDIQAFFLQHPYCRLHAINMRESQAARLSGQTIQRIEGNLVPIGRSILLKERRISQSEIVRTYSEFEFDLKLFYGIPGTEFTSEVELSCFKVND